MNLTTEEQRTLTEFLGECWHELAIIGDESYLCTKCGFRVPPFPLCLSVKDRLDFPDWRVVGRLLCQLENVSPLFASAFGHDFFYTPPEHRAEYVCRAVLAWLKEKGR